MGARRRGTARPKPFVRAKFWSDSATVGRPAVDRRAGGSRQCASRSL